MVPKESKVILTSINILTSLNFFTLASLMAILPRLKKINIFSSSQLTSAFEFLLGKHATLHPLSSGKKQNKAILTFLWVIYCS